MQPYDQTTAKSRANQHQRRSNDVMHMVGDTFRVQYCYQVKRGKNKHLQ